MILLSKVFLDILVEELVKDGKKQEKHDNIQYNQLDLCLWPRNQAIHTYETVNMGKKIHSLLINDWRLYWGDQCLFFPIFTGVTNASNL